jgi:hypothetical protein
VIVILYSFIISVGVGHGQFSPQVSENLVITLQFGLGSLNHQT